jgi:hypothetical protein
MKATKTNTTAISKLVARFEDELMEILLEDLRNLKARNKQTTGSSTANA